MFGKEPLELIQGQEIFESYGSVFNRTDLRKSEFAPTYYKIQKKFTVVNGIMTKLLNIRYQIAFENIVKGSHLEI